MTDDGCKGSWKLEFDEAWSASQFYILNSFDAGVEIPSLKIIDNFLTKFTRQQKGFADEESRKNSENGLSTILEKIKMLSEM